MHRADHEHRVVLRRRLVQAMVFKLLPLCMPALAQDQKLPDSPSLSSALPVSMSEAERDVRAGKFADAEATLRLYLQHDEASSQARYLLAYALMRQGKAKESLAEYTRAAALRKPTAEELRGVAQAYVLIEDYTDADKWLKLSLQMDPKNADTWYNLGRLRYTQNRFAEAVECFQRVLALVPHSVKAENNLGLTYEGLNRNQDAEIAYRQAITWQDTAPAAEASEQPLLNLAILLLHGSDATQAGPLLERAVAIAPKDPRIHEQLGQLNMRESKYLDAEREFKISTELDPERSSLHFLLGQAYKHLGKQQEALAEFAEAARLANSANGRSHD